MPVVIPGATTQKVSQKIVKSQKQLKRYPYKYVYTKEGCVKEQRNNKKDIRYRESKKENGRYKSNHNFIKFYGLKTPTQEHRLSDCIKKKKSKIQQHAVYQWPTSNEKVKRTEKDMNTW